jgi:hypothetical protein
MLQCDAHDALRHFMRSRHIRIGIVFPVNLQEWGTVRPVFSIRSGGPPLAGTNARKPVFMPHRNLPRQFRRLHRHTPARLADACAPAPFALAQGRVRGKLRWLLPS